MMNNAELNAGLLMKQVIERIADCEEYQIEGGSQYHKEEEKKIAYEDIKDILLDEIGHEMANRGHDEWLMDERKERGYE